MTTDVTQLLFTQLWQVTLLIVAVAGVNRWLSNSRPHLAHLLWLVVLVKCLTPPLWSSSGGMFCWLQPGLTADVSVPAEGMGIVLAPASFEPSAVGTTGPPTDVSVSSILVEPIESESRAASSSQIDVPLDNDDVGTAGYLVVVWLTVTGFVVAIVCWRWLAFWKLARSAQQRSCPELETQLNLLAKQFGLRRRVRLLVTESRIGPAVIGVFRTTVLLPAVVVDRLGGDAIRPILAHELLHVRRGDLWVGLLQTLTQTLWWFHPLVWWVSRLTTRDAERCCDEAVLAELNCDPAQYARALLDVLELKQELKPVPVFPGVRPVDVTSKRLERIMSLRQGCRRSTPWWCWIVALGFAALSLPGAAFVVNGQEQASEASPALDVNGTHETVARDSDEEAAEKSAIESNPDQQLPRTAERRSARTDAFRPPGSANRATSLQVGPVGHKTRLNLGPLKVLAETPASDVTAEQAKVWIHGGPDSIACQADELAWSQNGETTELRLVGDVALTTAKNKDTLVIQADEVTLRVSTQKQLGPAGIICEARKARVRFEAAGRRSDVDAELIRLQLQLVSGSFTVGHVDAQNIETLRVAGEKPQQSTSVDHDALNFGNELADPYEKQPSKRRVSPHFRNAPLRDVLGWLIRSANLTLHVETAGLEEEGITLETPISIDADDIMLQSVLNLVLKPLNLGWELNADEKLLTVTSAVRLRGRLIPVAYPVADLVIGVPDRLTLDLTKGGEGILPSIARFDSQVDGATVSFDELTELITSSVEPDSWKQAGGEGTIRTGESTLSLVIRQTQQVHEEISDLLDQFRRLQDLSVALRVEVLSAPPRFEERWGIDFDFQAIARDHGKTTPAAGRLHGRPFDVGGRAAMRVSRQGATSLRKVCRNRPAPKITLFNGQSCDLLLPGIDDQIAGLELHTVASADRRFIRMSLGLTRGNAERQSRSELPMIASGESVLLDVTGVVNPLFASEQDEDSNGRTMLLITGEVMVVEEEEELLGIELE